MALEIKNPPSLETVASNLNMICREIKIAAWHGVRVTERPIVPASGALTEQWQRAVSGIAKFDAGLSRSLDRMMHLLVLCGDVEWDESGELAKWDVGAFVKSFGAFKNVVNAVDEYQDEEFEFDRVLRVFSCVNRSVEDVRKYLMGLGEAITGPGDAGLMEKLERVRRGLLGTAWILSTHRNHVAVVQHGCDMLVFRIMHTARLFENTDRYQD